MSFRADPIPIQKFLHFRFPPAMLHKKFPAPLAFHIEGIPMSNGKRKWYAAGLLAIGIAGGFVFGFARLSAGQNAAAPAVSADEAAVHKAMEEFVNAFNAGDTKKLAATLTPTAEYIDDDSNRIEGSAAIADMLGKFFAANKGASLQITPEGSRTIAPGVVAEDGESVISVPDKKSHSTRKFTAIFAKVDGQWKLASIRDFPEDAEVITAEERLNDLAWFVGEWIDEGGDSLVTNNIRQAADKSHLIREFSVKKNGEELIKGMQWIGVDPLTGTLKGWSFDTAGGRSETTWTKNGEEWLVRMTGITSDGDESGATYLFKPLSKDRVELKVMHKVVGGEVEPDSSTVLVRRAPATTK